MSTVPQLALLALTLTGLASAATAQGVPNLSGTWVLGVEKSNFGAMPAPQNRTESRAPSIRPSR